MATHSALDRETRVRPLPLVLVAEAEVVRGVGLWLQRKRVRVPSVTLYAYPRMKWLVQEIEGEGKDRTYDVFLDGRIVLYDADSIAEAERKIADDGGTEYTLEELDGYRTQRLISR